MSQPNELDLPPPDSGSAHKDLNFKVSPDFRRRFKTEAALRGVSMKDLLEEAFKAYLEQNGGDVNRPAADLF